MPNVFFSYSHADEALRDELEKQLSMLKRQGVIETWHDRRIGAGEELHGAIDVHVESDDIVLLLVSPDFLASDYCYDIEMTRALERHDAGEAIVIPVILRPCDWQPAPFGKLNASPPDGKPITKWADRDEAFLEVAKAVRQAASRFTGLADDAVDRSEVVVAEAAATQIPPRSSNLRVAKVFSDQDKDEFKLEAFDYIARFFENSLNELGERNPGVEGRFRRVDANRFFASVYRNGTAQARCTVFMGSGGLGDDIGYVHGETTSSSTLNESLSVNADDQKLFLRSMGMSFGRYGDGQDAKLSMEGAAELFWEMLIEPLQAR
ncbi:MAG: toll/interleukin-1 receptor domain-containing protein [Pirellulales bacterium]|nr:toll/interleukin-1 receptor domain-containing protein [Pirellulales bacterium]